MVCRPFTSLCCRIALGQAFRNCCIKETIKQAVRELVNEHDVAGGIIKAIREITNDFTPPEDACGTYRLVYHRLEALEEDLLKHIHLENNVLFPRVLAEAEPSAETPQ
jgi:regulator of cell morphogenesis and NO signaling